MTERNEERLTPELRRVVKELRRPMDLGARVDQQVLAQLRGAAAREPRRGWGHLIAVGGLAVAAGLSALVLTRLPLTVAPRPDTQTVRFTITSASASQVSVVGDFNDWSPTGTPLVRNASGEWSVTLPLRPGRYRYGFLVDGRLWQSDPRLPSAPDPDFGTPTSVVTVDRGAL